MSRFVLRLPKTKYITEYEDRRCDIPTPFMPIHLERYCMKLGVVIPAKMHDHRDLLGLLGNRTIPVRSVKTMKKSFLNKKEGIEISGVIDGVGPYELRAWHVKGRREENILLECTYYLPMGRFEASLIDSLLGTIRDCTELYEKKIAMN